MASKIYIPTTGPSDWQPLLANPQKDWKDGYSAMSAANRWEHSNGLPVEIAKQFDALSLGPTELLLAIPEWKTPLLGGDTETQTDVFALVRTTSGVYACAIEAKVAEPFGPTISDWLKDASKGKLQRLEQLCGLLGVVNPPAGELRYQLFHRAAAALIEAKRFGTSGAALVVHSFSPHRAWLGDFKAFGLMLGGAVAPDAPCIVETPGDIPLVLCWACAPTASV
jgi:hypothetical protein